MTTHQGLGRRESPGFAAARVRDFIEANRLAVIVVGVAFVLRLAWLVYAQPEPVSDFAVYKGLAIALAEHRQLGYPDPTSFYLPVHPVLLAVLTLVSRSDVWLGFGMVVVATISCALVYMVGRRLFAAGSTALLAAGLFAVLPTFVLYSPVLATEHAFIALMLLALLLVLRLGDAAGWRAVAVGAVLGLAVLTRGEAMAYAPAFAAYLWLTTDRERSLRMRQVIFVGVGIVAVLTPWYARNALLTSPDAGLSSGSGINFYFAHNDSDYYGWYLDNPFTGMTHEEANREGWRLGFAYLRENPLRLFGDTLRGTLHLLDQPDYALMYSTAEARSGYPDFAPKDLGLIRPARRALHLTHLLHVAAAALAVLLARRWPRPVATLIVPLVGLAWVWRTVLFWATPRYGYFVMVMLVFLTALTVDTLRRAGRPGSGAEV